jgi:hypothetical protein
MGESFVRELRNSSSFDSVIGVATHRSGVAFLRNFLASLRDYAAYPIVVVINDFKDDDRQLFEGILNEFAHLPIQVATLRENYGEFGVLAAMDRVSRCDNVFLLSHSCEIKDPKLFEIVLEELPYESSVALSYLPFYRTHAYRVWTSFLGKYRRDVLRDIAFELYAPRSVFEFHLAEICLTHTYGIADPNVHVLFPDFVEADVFEEKFGRRVMKIENPYLIKWKSHWSLERLIRRSETQPGAKPSHDGVHQYFDRIPDGHRYPRARHVLSRCLEHGQLDGAVVHA